MAWIRMIPESEASAELKNMYDQVRGRWGGLDEIMQVHSLNPPSLMAHQQFYQTIMYGKSGLSRTQREMVAVVVSALNRCHY